MQGAFPVKLMTRVKIEAMLNKEIEKAFSSLDLKSPYPAEVDMKPYSSEYKVSTFQKFDSRKSGIKEHVVRFVDYLDPFTRNPDFSSGSSLNP